MAIFNEQEFYPTPQLVIEKMLLGVNLSDKVILEPSAGSGHIVDYLQANGAKEVLACEHNLELRRILSSKCQVIENDFFLVRPEDISHIDMIVMNPPFSNAVDHITHAFNIAPGGCEIIALCNSSGIKNPYGDKSKALSQLIELNGDWESFGDCFNTSDVERRANVDVACVRLFKPKTEEAEFEDYFCMNEDQEHEENGIFKYDYIRDIVNRYVGSVKLFDRVMDVSKEINELAQPISSYGIKFGAYMDRHDRKDLTHISRDYYKKDLQKRAWMHIFNKMNMAKYVTQGVREEINKFVEKQTNVPFTMRNIYLMIDLIFATRGNRMDKVLVETFDNVCKYSADNDNARHEVWKTNSDYKLNKRLIVPYICSYSSYGYKEPYVHIGYRSNTVMEDLTKALCFLTGNNYEEMIPVTYADGSVARDGRSEIEMKRRFIHFDELFRYSHGQRGKEWGEWHDWNFFRVKGYKKGTMHLEFKDTKVLDLFNQAVAKIKGANLPKGRKVA